MAKKLFIPTYKKTRYFDLEKTISQLDKLSKPFFLVYSIQFKNLAEKIKNSLKEKDSITGFNQVLGCSRPLIPDNTKSILLIGSGRFHAISLALETGLDVYIFEQGSEKISKVEEKEIQKFQKFQKTSKTRFLNAKSIGILVSLKPGQNRIKQALELKKQIENSLEKEAYLFIADTFNLDETENFPDIESWINTACPRLSLDKPEMINLNEVYELLDEN